MNTFNTHVYATVRVKVLGTIFSPSPKEVAEAVADAVGAKPDQWLKPAHGSVEVPNHGMFDIEHVEYADDVSAVLVDEVDAVSGKVIQEHLFDDARTLRTALADAIRVLSEHPDANTGNSKIHFALMKLKGALGRKVDPAA